MHHNRYAIILKNYMPHKAKIAILDKEMGRIDCIPDTERVSAGALITYTELSLTTYCFVRNVEQVAAPFAVARLDILFLHHVLEVCFLSIPFASREPDVFNLLCFLYQELVPFSLHKKKAFLAKLFFLLQIDSSDFLKQFRHYMAPILSAAIDTMAMQLIDLAMEKKFDEWLYGCIEEHPYRDRFKTIDFYRRMAAYEHT